MSRKKGKTKPFSAYRNGMRPKTIGFKEKTLIALTEASSTNWRETKNFIEHFLDQVAEGNIKYRLPGTSLWADINSAQMGIIPVPADGLKDASKVRYKDGKKLLTAQREVMESASIGFKESTFNKLTEAGEAMGRNLKNFVEHLLDQFADGHIKYRVPGTNLWVDIYNAKTPIDAVPEEALSPVVPMEAMQNANEPIVNIPSITEPINNSTGTGDPIIVNPADSNSDSPETSNTTDSHGTTEPA